MLDRVKNQSTPEPLDITAVGGTAAAQVTLGLGGNLYASRRDYNGLYDQVTAAIKGVQVGDWISSMERR